MAVGSHVDVVSNHVTLVTKLPDEIKEFLLRNDDPAVARHFTERRLRPIAAMGEDEAYIAAFREAVGRRPT